MEKGPYNLETLYYIMELSRHPHVHPMIGNCDVVCRNVLYDTRLEFLQNILLNRPNSILHEMAQRVGQRIDKETDMAALSRELRKVFLRELTFIDRLPHVIETERFIFTHAGIRLSGTFRLANIGRISAASIPSLTHAAILYPSTEEMK